jgi:biopolymer transport protein ExbD
MVLTYVVIDLPTWALYFHDHPGSRGLPVRLWHAQAPTTALAQSIVVRLTLSHRQLYIDDQPVTRDNFENELRKKLTTRQPNCPIYFQGDRSLEWHDAAEVIVMIRKLGGNVIL